jgi:hypothetical protein
MLMPVPEPYEEIQMFTIIPYLYRDASNYKEGDFIILEGTLSESQIAAIEDKLDEGENFIPADLKLGIEELQDRLTSFPSEDDHVWHELQLSEIEVVASVPDGSNTIPSEDFVAAFEKIADSNSWDVAGCMERLDIS